MIRYILDTDTLSLIQRNDADVVAFLYTLPVEEIATTVITYEEQVQGRLAYIQKAKDLEQREVAYQLLTNTALFFSEFTLINFSQRAQSRFENLKDMRLNVGPNDLSIVAIALENDAAVITRNVRDFARVPNLKIINWLSE
jgi:tRNA(fMet)-specific endonuclease VapC